MKNNSTARFMITAQCDPHNALFHYNHQNILALDGATPIKWVQNDNYGIGFDYEEALTLLDDFANYIDCDTAYYDDSVIAQLTEEIRMYEGFTPDFSWYDGAGWYANECLVHKHGFDSLRDDVMLYRVEMMEA